MSAVSFASAGYVCQPIGSVQTTVVVSSELQGTITEEDALQGMITEDCAAPDYDLLTFALVSGAPIEIGSTFATPSFTATHNRPPTSLVLTNNANAEAKNVVATPNAFQSDQNYQLLVPGSVTWTLTGDDGGPSDAEVVSKLWQARLFIGWTTNPGPYTEADILALNQLINALDANALFDVTLNPTSAPTGAYLVAAYHDVFNGAVPSDFEIGNFGNGDVTEVQTGELITVPGGTAPYSIARSDNLIEAPAGVRFARES